jgi:hypothetical protein
MGTGWLEILDIPGAWGRADAYGRGTIEVDIQPLEATVLGTVRTASPAPPSSAAGRAS